MRGGDLIEVRGDEALAVFGSARQALRAAVDLQIRFEEESRRDADLPLGVGIGVDSGEAVRLAGGFRGAALNVAARLCALAHAGEVIATDSVIHLAGKVDGIRYVDRGRVHLKGIPAPVHIVELRREVSPVQGGGWSWRPLDWSKALGWRLILAVCVIAAATAAAVVVLTTRGPSGRASPKGMRGTAASTHQMETESMAPTATNQNLSPAQRLNKYVEGTWTCHPARDRAVGALASVACRTDVPDRLRLTLFRDKRDLEREYNALLASTALKAGRGRCTADAWAGETEWFHGIGEPGGRAFCYISETKQRTYLSWTSEAGAKVLGVAQLDSLLHRKLFFWWANIRHDIV